MKTTIFLHAISLYGWETERQGAKHTIVSNVLFPVERPLAIRRQDCRDIDRIIACQKAKEAGLIWDEGSRTAYPNPKHPYFERYQKLFGPQGGPGQEAA